MEANIICDNLTEADFIGVRSAIAKVGGKTICATLDNNSVYVDNQPRAYFYECSPEQLQALFYAVANQVRESIERQSKPKN